MESKDSIYLIEKDITTFIYSFTVVNMIFMAALSPWQYCCGGGTGEIFIMPSRQVLLVMAAARQVFSRDGHLCIIVITSSISLNNYNACERNMRHKSNYFLNRKSEMCSPEVQLHKDFHLLTRTSQE